MRRQRDPRLEQLWRRIMARWQASGRSIRGFCAEQSISEANFHAWRRELTKRDAEPTAASKPAKRLSAEPSTLQLVPLRVVPDTVIELVLPTGMTVRVPSVEAAAKLIAALESAAC